MLGAIIGDIVGSRFEWNNHKSKEFELFTEDCFVTDDSIMTIAVAKALMESKGDYSDLGAKAIKAMQELGRPYPNCGFGGSFYNWIYSDNPEPYGSYGNGSAMRISPVGWVAKDIEQAKELSRKVTEISHNHLEGVKGAESVAVAIVLARQGKTMEEIRKYINEQYYPIDFTLDEIRDTYKFNETCQDTIPQAFQAFFESTSFEDAIRNAISIGGDSDTLAAITTTMTHYFRITGYSPEHDICFIMDSNGMFEKLWEFSVFIREHGCKVLEVSSDEKFIDINIEKVDPEPNKIILRASATGKPTYTEQTIDGTTHKVIDIEGKQYIPE